jgi:hypothetical protein
MKPMLTAAALIVALVGCAAGPQLPPPVDDAPRPVEETRDYDNWGREENRAAREAEIDGRRLGDAEIDQAFRGRVLRGCYPSGDAFAEYLAEDGKFYDAANNNALLGQWGVQDDMLCFQYQSQQGAACFAVFAQNGTYDFYSADLSAEVASTACASSTR